ncbi:MAG: AraC family transcriptional regulator [Bacteroidota bacterium]
MQVQDQSEAVFVRENSFLKVCEICTFEEIFQTFMLVLPQRLLDQSFVDVLWQQDGCYLLRKIMNNNSHDRHGYLSSHAFSVVVSGKQQVQSYEGAHMVIHAGEIGFLPRAMYTITDLVAEERHFEAILLFIPEARMKEFLPSDASTALSEAFAEHLWKAAVNETLHDMLDMPASLIPLHFVEQLFLLKGGARLRHLLLHRQGQLSSDMGEFMESHFDKPLTIADYAYLTGRSLSTFHREFQQRFDTSPRQWIKEKRLEKSRQLLSEHGASVTDTVYAVGYQHISNFIKAFKARYQLTPKQYVLQQRGK